MAVADRGDRAVLDPGRDRLDPRLFEPPDDLVRLEPGREIDVADRQAEQVVADRAADVAGQPLVRAERVEQPRHAAASCAISRRRASAPLQPARQIDDHRRGRPPDPASVPVDLVIVALAALEQGAARLLVGGVEQEVERRLEPVGDLMLVRLERKIGRDDAEHRRHDIAGDGAIAARSAPITSTAAGSSRISSCASRSAAATGVLAGIDPPAGKGDLAGVRAQMLAADGQDHARARAGR